MENAVKNPDEPLFCDKDAEDSAGTTGTPAVRDRIQQLADQQRQQCPECIQLPHVAEVAERRGAKAWLREALQCTAPAHGRAAAVVRAVTEPGDGEAGQHREYRHRPRKALPGFATLRDPGTRFRAGPGNPFQLVFLSPPA